MSNQKTNGDVDVNNVVLPVIGPPPPNTATTTSTSDIIRFSRDAVLDGTVPRVSAWPARISGPSKRNAPKATTSHQFPSIKALRQKVSVDDFKTGTTATSFVPQPPPSTRGPLNLSLVSPDAAAAPRTAFDKLLRQRFQTKLNAIQHATMRDDDMYLLRAGVAREILSMFAGHFPTYETMINHMLSFYDALMERFNVLRHSFEQLSEDATDWKTKHAALNEEFVSVIAAKDQELAKYRKKIEDRRRENLLTQIDLLRKEILKRDDEVEDMRVRTVRYMRDVTELENKIKAMEQNEQQMKKDIADARNQAEAELARCLNVLKDFEAYRMRTEQVFVDRSVELSNAEARAATAEEEVQKLTEELRTSQQQMRRKTVEFRKRIAEVPLVQPTQAAGSADMSERTHTPRPDWEDLLGEMAGEDSFVEEEDGSVVHIMSCSSRFKAVWLNERCRDAVESTLQLQSALRDRERLLRFMDEEAASKAPPTKEKIAKSFTGRGTGPNVPVHLRFAGSARNRAFPKREVELQIRELLRYYDSWSQKHGNQIPFAECCMAWLRGKYGNNIQQLMDHSYSFVDALERFKDDADCEMMLSVLDGVVPHFCFKEQVALVVSVQQWLASVDKSESESGKTTTGKIGKKRLFSRLHEFFSWYSEDALEKLKIAIHTDNSNNIVEYNNLFVNDHNFNESHFVERVRDEYRAQAITFIEDMRRAALKGGDKDGNITARRAIDALAASFPGHSGGADAHRFDNFIAQCIEPEVTLSEARPETYEVPVNVDWLLSRFRQVFLSHIPHGKLTTEATSSVVPSPTSARDGGGQISRAGSLFGAVSPLVSAARNTVSKKRGSEYDALATSGSISVRSSNSGMTASVLRNSTGGVVQTTKERTKKSVVLKD
eukprot:PhM_4_TR14715/c0_g1_i1/m.7588